MREEGAIYGEFPDYEPGHYTFLADYLSYANGDGMEHRNSTVMTSSGVDRERPRAVCSTRWRTSSSTTGTSSGFARATLEPFDLDRANMSGELWLAEGLHAVLRPAGAAARRPGDLAATATTLRRARGQRSSSSPGATGAVRRRNEPHGAVHGRRPDGRSHELGEHRHLVLSVRRRHRARARSDAARADRRPRHARRLHARDVARARQARRRRARATSIVRTRRRTREARLAEVSGDAAFARDFFAGTSAAARWPTTRASGAGRLRASRSATAAARGGATCARCARRRRRASAPGARELAGVRRGHRSGRHVTQIDGERVTSAEAVNTVFSRHRPGERVTIAYIDRRGATRTATSCSPRTRMLTWSRSKAPADRCRLRSGRSGTAG